ncbi:esterase [Streptomyces mobaraensis NBRC 13819 = DSM 40847]|uniref:Putative esterase n=1 Tax=Streptomyces mobaraensis (strain ATCC 29032 / DSM 40847 / JCM 4168 / NBRC 13819 / NCIMB 11159 / IPCR 16-22) TaxID=1223523 RepID=M3A191_STRM1|nr:putative esterase [Streptomyces mobaraensis]EME98818.1 putative esterase [Streptomyces mobaraensis NBRC 13819 = DSM 40847]QTT77189.1 esterase [Streptomyces mobaraensis NBRC 13819 = DSM 40847]
MPTYETRQSPAAPPGRRTVVAAALLAAVAGPAARAAAAAPDRPRAAPAPLRLPAPTGPHAIGTAALHLTDTARPDPWRRDRPREVMVSFWYPAAAGPGGAEPAPHMEPAAAVHFGGEDGMAALNYRVPPGSTDWRETRSHARPGARVLPGGPRPVVLWSSGVGDPRTWGTGLVEELASRGYVVVTVDHTYEASEVRFPDGTLVASLLPALMKQEKPDLAALTRLTMEARVGDATFVLDRLHALRHGGRTAAERALPRGLAEALDLSRTGMAGHSGGGFTAAQVLRDDRRLVTGINLDGQMHFPARADGTGVVLGEVAEKGLDRPFLLVGSAADVADNRPSWDALVRHSRGHVRRLIVHDTAHGAFTDAAALLPPLAERGTVPRETVTELLGALPAERSIAITRGLVTAFLDRRLRDRDTRPGDVPTGPFPEVERA